MPGCLAKTKMEEEEQHENIIVIRGFPVSFPKVRQTNREWFPKKQQVQRIFLFFVRSRG